MAKVTNFVNAYKEWIAAGCPRRSPERVREIYAICEACPRFSKKADGVGKCLDCGCPIKRDARRRNKLVLATTECPLRLWRSEWRQQTNRTQDNNGTT